MLSRKIHSDSTRNRNFMKYLSILLFSLLLFSADPKPANESFVMVQLFTSQGCSSCPPADQLVEVIKEEYKDQNVYVMSYHVDYWNRLGWKDPFSKKEFTQLQYSYADQFRERRVYTPQIVVNGKEHFVGSDGFRLRKRIKSYLKKTSTNNIAIKSQKDGDDLQLTFEVSGETTGKRLKLAFVLENSVTKVKRGENSNRTLSNSNIVLQETEVKLDENNKASFRVPLKGLDSKKMSLISFVQTEKLEITGAAQISF